MPRSLFSVPYALIAQRTGAGSTGGRQTSLQTSFPDLQRALRLNFRLADIDMRRTASAELLDRLSQACVLVDAAARVLFANRGAEEIFNDRVGLHRSADGTLYNGQQAETSRLHRLIASAARRGGSDTETGGDRIRLPRGEAQAPLGVLVIPLRAATDWLAPAPPPSCSSTIPSARPTQAPNAYGRCLG